MHWLFLLLFLSGAYPLGLAWWDNRSTSLIQALSWASSAWLVWIMTLFLAEPPGIRLDLDPARYLALCLTGCSGIAVLGARRPHVAAWNFVVLGLLAVMVLPLVENIIAGTESLGLLRLAFLGATLAVGILNYLPTRLASAALFLALGSSGEMIVMIAPAVSASLEVINLLAQVCLVVVPWLAWWSWRRSPPAATEFDRLWLDFRNRFGLVWAQRVREQFNHSAANAGWPVFLSWQGLRRTAADQPPELTVQIQMLETLKALLKRFGPAD